jgi:hypothetical protein
VAAEFAGMAAIVLAVFLLTTAQMQTGPEPQPVEGGRQIPQK